MAEQPTLEENVRAIRVHLDHADQFFTAFWVTLGICIVIGVALVAGLAIYEWFR